MGNAVFNFAMGPYPKESRIAQAKRNAVGGKRKRCTKGKNCSAACIAANMVCLVDLPWVGPSLTKAVAQIQAMKGKAAPAAKTAPVASAAKPVPAAKTAPAPASTPQPAAPAAKPAPKVKIETVDKYKSFGLPFLEQAMAAAAGQPASKTPDGKKAIANIKQAIAELKGQPPKMAPGAQAVTPTPKPATTPKLADKLAAQGSSLYSSWDTKQLVKFQNSLMANPKEQKLHKAVIDMIQQELDSRGYQKPTIPIVPYARPGSQDNRQGLNEGQYKIWNSFFKPFTKSSIEDYKDVGSAYMPTKFTPGSLEHRQNQIVKKAHSISQPWSQINAQSQKEDIPKVASIQKAVDTLGLKRVKDGVNGIRSFTGVTYEEIRSAQRNRVPRGYDYMDDAGKQKMIKEGKKKADDIEAVLKYMPKPQVPKMRGVAVDDTKLNDMIDLVKNRGSMQELAMNSWSTNSRTPQDFAKTGVANGYGANRVIYRTLNKKGSSVQGISGLSSEDEILTPANAKYKFYDHHTVKGDGGNIYHIFDVVEY